MPGYQTGTIVKVCMTVEQVYSVYSAVHINQLFLTVEAQNDLSNGPDLID
jgi:hypothetical protein